MMLRRDPDRKVQVKDWLNGGNDSCPATPGERFASTQDRKPAAICILLFLLVAWAFLPSIGNGFINFDDPDYVTANTHVQAGPGLESLGWAFRSTDTANWHPVTWLSHMLDCQAFGLRPWGHHLTSVLLHAVNAILVFLVLRSMTGAAWRSLSVAALFGLHPLRVESVAWIAERKDVLSACFGLLALLFYAHYTKDVASGEDREPSSRIRPLTSVHYWLALLFCACGLMSKPVLVTLPCMMLLLDFWPLRRFQRSTIWRLAAEKAPFFAAAVGASAVAFWVHQMGGAVETMTGLPLAARGGNALVSYCRYLGKIFYPINLCAYYPHPGQWPAAKVFLAGSLLFGISALVIRAWRKCPYLLTGWLWFAGGLVPAIGVLQVGAQALADRYTYLPSVGLFIALTWGLGDLARRWRSLGLPLSVAALTAAVLCIALTRRQVSLWKDSETVFRHALAVTEQNDLAHNNLGHALLEQRRLNEAVDHFQCAVQINPGFAEAHYNLGVGWFRLGRLDEALSEFRKALDLKPTYAEAHYNLGVSLIRQGRFNEGISELNEALRLNPDDADARNSLRVALTLKDVPAPTSGASGSP